MRARSTAVTLVAGLFLVAAQAGAGEPQGRPNVDTKPAEPAKPKVAPACSPLPVHQWALNSLLVIQEATTCSYKVTWNGWSPPRDYLYAPDADGWISDYFIFSGHARVFWNLRTNEGAVRPISQDMPLTEQQGREVAGWAKQTNFPGLDLSKVVFNPSPCPPGACARR
jgi:hypothetical protein